VNPSYIELHARSAFSFLRGASLPEQLAETAAQRGLPAMALCDRDGVYGAPRFFAAAREAGVRPIIGAELTLEDGSILPVLVATRPGYQNLCRLLTTAHLRAPKGEGFVRWDELPEFAAGLVALTGDQDGPLMRSLLSPGSESGARSDPPPHLVLQVRAPKDGSAEFKVVPRLEHQRTPQDVLDTLQRAFGAQNVFVEIQRHLLRDEERVNTRLVELARASRLPLLATNGVRYAAPSGRAALDVFTCIREHTHLDAAGTLLAPNSERFVKDSRAMGRLFHDLPEALASTVGLAERLQFSLQDLGYQFPSYPVPAGETMDSFLEKQVLAGARERYDALTPKVLAQLRRELDLIHKLGFSGYFLIVWDICQYCRDHGILVQGRGSAANSAVCFCLRITAVDPVGANLLFERFLSEGRKGWPDIDLDLPSGERRERVIQEVYQRYGQRGAAMTANVITFRGRSAAREIGKALNFAPEVLDRFSHLFTHGDFPHTLDLAAQLVQAGVPPSHPRARPFVELYEAIHGSPRHLGQHSGGMIICQGQLDSVVPLENAAMPGRVVAQWDKDDCEDLGIVKVDLLGLGMMAVLQDAIELTARRGHPVDLAKIPKDDPATFAMMQTADTIGVFQIESRAQMATLPRMQPTCFYDVVIEVAIIRPGPIQGDLVHPYLARRSGRQPVTYFDERLRPVLERTLGVPLFQEQLLKIAMVMASFTGAEAEELRRALSFHRSQERMQKVGVKLRAGMAKNGVAPDKMEAIIQAILAFALYGFPESHAISFAILSYASAYLKAHFAPEFYACLLNNQPMGFYSSDTLIKDARRHGVRVRPVCVAHSDWDCTIESDNAIRLGLRVVGGLRKEPALALLGQRQRAAFASLQDFKLRSGFNKEELRTLAGIGALNCFAAHRREALWDAEKPERTGELLPDAEAERGLSPLLPMTPLERLQTDYQAMNLSTAPHPMTLARPGLKGVLRAGDLAKAQPGALVRIAGHVICRQRPGTAKGFVFVSLEDETGVANAIVAPALFEQARLVITQESFLIIEGRVQSSDNVVLVQARHIEPLRYESLTGSPSHDFH